MPILLPITAIGSPLCSSREHEIGDARPNDRQGAIAIYRSEPPEDRRVRGRLPDLKARLEAVEARASAQEAVQRRVIGNLTVSGFSGPARPSRFVFAVVAAFGKPDAPRQRTTIVKAGSS